MPNDELKPGDVVELKSGSIPMTIGWIESGMANCFWLGSEREIKSESIPVAALKRKQ